MQHPDQPNPLPPPSSRTSLTATLRQATAETHAAVEQLPIMLRLTSPSVTRDDYRRYLQTLAILYASVETPFYNGLDDAVRERLGIRPKLPALLRDLEAQGDPAPTAIVEPDPRTPNVVEPRSASALVGGLYVLEGATLGGRTIARHLRRVLGDGLGAASFLDFHGEQTSAAWKRFSGALDELCADGTLLPEAVIAGALVAFQDIYRRLEQASKP